MTAGHSDKDGQRETTGDSRAVRHSQTLPLITEEITASHPTSTSAPSDDVTTPVLPPNPIPSPASPTRDSAGATSADIGLDQGVASAEAGAAPVGAGVASAEEPAKDAEAEQKSEGRISATQLIAGAGAAATSSVIGGQLGVAGTVIGAGIASIVTGLAVTLYSHSLDKGKEKIKEVGSKLAPAVKAQISPNGRGHTDRIAGQPEKTTTLANPGETVQHDTRADSAAEEAGSAAETGKRTWWQQLRRKRVLYPVGIAVAAFGIGLGGVVMAESFTHVDISPGTSQISRAVSGESTTTDDSGSTDGSHSGETSAGSDSSGSQPGGDRAGTNDGSQSGESATGGDNTSTGASDGTQTDQGANTGADDSTGTDTTEGGSGSTSTDGTQAGSDSSSSDSGSTGSSGSSSGSSGSGTSSSGSGANGSGAGGSGSSGTSSGSGGSAASAQG